MDKIMTRRTLVRAAFAGVGAAAGVRIQGARGATLTNATAFTLCGDESHNSDYIRTALTATLVEDGGLSVDFSDQEKFVTYDHLRKYKILIMFRDGRSYNNGYWHQIYWNEKKDKVVSVPPIRRKIQRCDPLAQESMVVGGKNPNRAGISANGFPSFCGIA
jgi:hypothetical protein